MAPRKAKYYVVWAGRRPGVYLTWADCEAQVKGAAGARYKAFATRAEAERALSQGPPPQAARRTDRSPAHAAPTSEAQAAARPAAKAWAVDAACSGNPGPMEYQGVDIATGRRVFHLGPIHGTNNIGEFLAIVHAMALIKQQGLTGMTLYSDSRNALLWLRARKCRTRLPENSRTAQVHELIRRAERWLAAHDWSDIRVEKWPTRLWGEVPADFGRK